MEKLKKMMAEKKAGYLQDVEDKQLEEAAKEDDDEAFTEFKERIKRRPAQVLRYQRGGDPLLVSKENKPQKIPPCENCNSRRTFEFQIMPQLLNKLNCSNENSIDWGVLLVTLVKSPVSSLGTSGSLFGSKIMLTSKIKILARKVNIDKMNIKLFDTTKMNPKEMKEYTEYQQYTVDKWSEILEHYKIVVSRVKSVQDFYRKLYKENTDQLREATFETVTGEWALNEVLEKMEENLKLYIEKLKKCVSKLNVNIDRLKVEINDGKHKRPKEIAVFTKQANKFIDHLNMVINFYNTGEFIIDDKVLTKESFLAPMELIEIRKISTRNQNGQRKTKVIVRKQY